MEEDEDSEEDLTDQSPDPPKKRPKNPGSSRPRQESGQSRDSFFNDQENRQPPTHGFRTKEQIFRERARNSKMAKPKSGGKAGKTAKTGKEKRPQSKSKTKRKSDRLSHPRRQDASDSEPEIQAGAQEEELLKELAALKKENKSLKAKNPTPPVPVSMSKRRKFAIGADQIPVALDLTKKVCDYVKFVTWRRTKFLATENKLYGVCAQIMREMEEFQHLLEETDDEDTVIKAFASVYGKDITKVLNERRTNTASSLKKAFDKRAAKKQTMPTPKQLSCVISRSRDLLYLEVPEDASEAEEAKIMAKCAKNDELRDFFDWYWDSLLPCVQGKFSWGHGMRYYHTISGGHFPEDKTKKYVTSSDEALVLLMYENYYKRWPYTFECSEKKEKIDQESPRYQVKWSDSTTGNSQWGGWSSEGRLRFREILKVIAKCRNKRYNAKLEKQALKRIRTVKKLDKPRKGKKSGAAGANAVGTDEECAMLDWNSDDESAADDDLILDDFEGSLENDAANRNDNTGSEDEDGANE